MKVLKIAALLAILGIAGLKAHEKGLLKRWFGKQPDQIGHDEALDAVLGPINARRSLLGHQPLVGDGELDDWIAEEASAIVPSNKGIERFLRNLQNHVPAVAVAKAEYVENRDAGALIASLKDWQSVTTDADLTHFSLHVFPRSSWNRFRAAAVAVRKLPRFDPALLGIGQGESEVYNICPQCEHAHVTTIARRSLYVVLSCDRCNQAYDIFSMRLDGSYVRATELLQGYEAFAAFGPGMSKFEEMMAIWGAVLSEFTYTHDMMGARGPQDTWQTAAETAAFRNGDCEDTSIFMADWLIARGIDTRVAFGLAWSDYLRAWEGHAWCVARIGDEEYILESTAGVPDSSQPPLTTEASHAYVPIAMFDRDHIYFRDNDGWTPRYWSDSEWRAVRFPRADMTAPPPRQLGEFEIGARFFGREHIDRTELARAGGAATD